MIPQRKDLNKVSPVTALASCPEAISKQRHTEEPTWQPSSPTEFRSYKAGQAELARICGADLQEKRELCIQRTGEL